MTFIGGLGIARSSLLGSDDRKYTSIPAVHLASEASPVVTKTLRTITIPAEYLPAGEIRINNYHYVHRAGTTDTFPPLPWNNVAVEIVLAGSFEVTSDGPRRIWRAGSDAPPEDIAAGTKGVLNPGDIVAYLDNSALTVQVLSDENVAAFGIVLIGSDDMIGANGDASLEVREVTLEPGATQSDTGETPVTRFVRAGVLTTHFSGENDATPQGGIRFSGIVPFTPLSGGVTLTMSNNGKVPLVLLEAIVTLPVEAGTPTS